MSRTISVKFTFELPDDATIAALVDCILTEVDYPSVATPVVEEFTPLQVTLLELVEAAHEAECEEPEDNDRLAAALIAAKAALA